LIKSCHDQNRIIYEQTQRENEREKGEKVECLSCELENHKREEKDERNSECGDKSLLETNKKKESSTDKDKSNNKISGKTVEVATNLFRQVSSCVDFDIFGDGLICLKFYELLLSCIDEIDDRPA
jgi:hypothetical protein